MEKQLDDTQNELLTSKKNIEFMKKQLDDTQNELLTSKKKIEFMEKQLDDTQNELLTAKKNIEFMKKQLDDTQNELLTSKKKIEFMKKQLDDTQNELLTSKKKIEFMEKQLDDTQNELLTSKKNIEFMKKQLDEFVEEKTEMKNQQHALVEKYEVLTNKNILLEKKLEEQKRDNQFLTTKRDELQRLLSKRNRWNYETAAEFRKEEVAYHRKNWEEEQKTLIANERKNWEEEKESLLREKDPRDGSALQIVVNRLPNWLKSTVAPKGILTGDELGVMMGALVAITAYPYANESVKITVLGAFASLCGILMGKVFNNVVTYISMDKEAKVKPSLKKAANSITWIIIGGVVPLFCGFIQDYWTRFIVTAILALAMKIIIACIWTVSYGVSKCRAMCVVVLGVIGISLAAGVPHVLKMIAT